MRKILLAAQFTGITLACISQPAPVQEINKIVTPETALEPLKYLASDELKGRSPKRPEIDVAARYIAKIFKDAGVKEIEGANEYFQLFDLKSVTPASSGSLSVNNRNFEIGKDLFQIGGSDVSLNAPLIFIGFGGKPDIAKADLKGKIVVSNFGISDSSTVNQSFQSIKEKEALFREKGAVAMIESYWQKDVPWSNIQAYLSRDRVALREDSIPVFLINFEDTLFAEALKNSPQARLNTSGNSVKVFPAKNVMGRVAGTDPKLKDQCIVLSAHYDHLGVASQPKMEDGKMDSIYNGARDNAIGVTAVVNAARYFAKHPPKRTVAFILFTAEEMGLVGSRYYGDHPVIPFNKVVYNLNCDNGGYNDTSIVTVIGLGRTSADDDITKAAAAYGVKATTDPVPELNLFDRSDNLNFAIKGIPAPTYGMGITAFDSVMRQRYHQLSDEVATFDLRYALIYIRSYVLAAKNIADNPAQPTWKTGDKYEAAWKKLYTSAK